MYDRNESDETLVLLTLAGEQTAYEILVTRYQKAVVASAAAITKNHFMAEDAAQDAFVTAWMKLNTLLEPKKYGSWVCRIAKNCALNMLSRYRSFIPLDTVDNLDLSDGGAHDPAELYALSEERSEVNKSIAMLPEKVRQIIHLHYFEGLAVAEIADRMRISESTVKWQLHDGRKRIRKELCAMDEKYTDTLVQRVMKKVEELKLWQIQNDKSGFEKVYREVLREVEELPECRAKQYALADVLMRGWWWLPGDKNDALFARIASAAEEGKNEEVMTFIVAREDSRVYGGARVDFMRDKQIPRLEKAGFVKALGREWFWLGYYLFRDGKKEEALAAYDRAEAILRIGEPYRALVPYARQMEEILEARYQGVNRESYLIGADAEEYRMIDGALRYWSTEGFRMGQLGSIDHSGGQIFRNASVCDGYFFADVALGQTYRGSDGTALSHISDGETVETPVGRFENCALWEARRWTDFGKTVCRTYYKDGIGIVRQEHITDTATDVRTLCAYDLKGGKGLLPLCAGNTWEYASDYAPDAVSCEVKASVAYADDSRVIVSTWKNTERKKYDESSWLDAVQEIANEYCHHQHDETRICDVSEAIARAERLAVTPMEKAHTKAAVSVVRRIMATDPEFNPDHTATGHWNFFERTYLRKKQDTLCETEYNFRWSFEWKRGSEASEPLLHNDIYGILQDAANCLWSDEWRIGASPIVEYTKWDRTVKTKIVCEDGGTVTTKAGTFENCLKLSLDVGGMNDGWSYRGGKKAYWFAEGVGIVRTESSYCGGIKTAVYELTSYEGTGEGYMPIADGLFRRYDAPDLTDGYVGAVEYTYVADEDGDIVLFTDRIGIRELPPPITQYGSIQGEVIEEKLFDERKWKEGHLKYAANQFHLLLHMIARPSRNRMAPKRSVELQSFYMNTMELLGENGAVPPAWYGPYAWASLVKAAALFGNKQKEEGYEALSLALDYCEKIAKFAPGDLLDTGKEEVLGGIKYVYQKDHILLPDGSREPISYEYRMNYGADDAVWALTARGGWEWFNSVRNEDRFKDMIERAKKMK
ncbi:MAG: RNA polymerase sigma factor [Clostridia bacterium]|nr:RNA polymerase sigma factor [Clostridia bacterium]